ncbi:hypothetical protein BASA81_005646 [Batrachochytrium salamandrivorans]|nr:hypothetical protein BASA81_005646 [Batrachochytrium salamandrivorans]
MLLHSRIKSGEVRDEEDVSSISLEFGKVIVQALQQPEDALVQQVQESLLLLLSYPEFNSSAFFDAGLSVEHNLILACARAQVCDNPQELLLLLAFSLRLYTSQLPGNRPGLFAIWQALLQYERASAMLLRLCLQCISETLAVTADAAVLLLNQSLLPLHLIKGKLSPTQSLLEGFHSELTLCLARVCELHPNVGWDLCIQALTSSLYPTAMEGNSPKEVLILHELETLLSRCALDKFSDKSRACVCTRLLSCISSQHGMVCQRALLFWQSDHVFMLLQPMLGQLCDLGLAKASQEHWSVTVKSMASAALLRGKEGNTLNLSPMLNKAVEHARQVQLTRLQVPETAPMPKSFSSTSVIRDALEPFAFGAFGVVWQGRAIVPGLSRAQWPLVALKELDSAELARAEIEAMSAVHLVLELVQGPGDLHQVVVERTSLSLELTRWFGAQLGNAITHVHAKGFVFGDVKPENVLVTHQGQVKLCDFGGCFLNGREGTRGVGGGTVEYLAPEQLPSFSGDWWAFGCVLHFMSTGRPPVFFQTEEEADLPGAFTRAVTFADQRGGVHIADHSLRMLVASLCSRDPLARPLDGGESSVFFQPSRPWREAVKLNQYPGLPKPNNNSNLSSGGGTFSPWQRRTFSAIHNPLPVQYSTDFQFLKRAMVAEFSRATLHTTFGATSSSSPPVSFLPAPGTTFQLLETATKNIPKRILHRSEQSSGQRGNVEGGKNRRTARNYNVGGLDLSAG